MRCLIVSAMLLLALGCISERTDLQPEEKPELSPPEEPAGPEPPPAQEHRYLADGFSFRHPGNMAIESSRSAHGGLFAGTHTLAGGQTGEMLLVVYLDTEAVYGVNQDGIFRSDPTKAASDMLKADLTDDQVAGLLNSAYEVGKTSTFAIARDGTVAEVPFKIRFGDSDKTYHGYALDIYIPDRSLHVKARVLAIDRALAESIRNEFLLSFRLEQA